MIFNCHQFCLRQFSNEERELQGTINVIWDKLFLDAKITEASLVVVKKKFTAITVEQIGDFQGDLKSFYQRFITEGPGVVGDDLDKGRLCAWVHYRGLACVWVFKGG